MNERKKGGWRNEGEGEGQSQRQTGIKTDKIREGARSKTEKSNCEVVQRSG